MIKSRILKVIAISGFAVGVAVGLQGLPVQDALNVGTQVHTSPAMFGKVMSSIKPRLAVAYHFFNDFETQPEFETEVWPILKTHCMECHGEQQTYSNLRLDSPTAIRRGGELGEVLVPGDPESSEIYRRTALPPDDLDFMPVDNEPLNEEELERLRDWIAAGADFGTWSGP